MRPVVPWFGRLPVLAPFLAGLVACANDPLYMPAPAVMDAGVVDVTTGMRSQAKAQLALPIKTERAGDLAKRQARATALGVTVPYVRIGDLAIEVEWTIKNLDTTRAGQALIELDGASEYFAYDPSMIVLDPDDEDATPAPGLAGNIPIDVPAGGQVSGLFTEDELREAAIDLDQITRGNINPFRATLTISKNATAFQPLTPPVVGANGMTTQAPSGPVIPREAFAELVRVDLVFKPTTHMTLDYAVRVRDLRGILHDLLLAAQTDKPGELQTFMPAVWTPATAAAARTAAAGRTAAAER